MEIKLENKTKVDDDVIMAFIERVYEAHGLSSTVAVKVTTTTSYVCPGAEMWAKCIFPPKGFKVCADAYVKLRLPSTTLIHKWGSRKEEVAAAASDWFEEVVRHEFTHIWQSENLPHFKDKRFNGERSTRRVKWNQRPIEVDCNRRMKEVEAEDGTEDQANVIFYKNYLANELLGG